MLKVAVVGASGYTGLELLRLLARHPEVEIVAVTSREYVGKPLTSVFPALAQIVAIDFTAPDPESIASQADFIFTALPHKAAMGVIPAFMQAGCQVVDLSADFRFQDQNIYEQWYQPHSAPELLSQAVYGLPELYREAIRGARLVGNPGCYPISVILGLAPLLKADLLDPETIIADCKSGVSGAGRGVALASLFCEVNEGFRAYKVAEHRHTPEIEQELSRVAGYPVRVTFTPHLVPMSRGILATLYGHWHHPVTESELYQLYRDFYQGHPFIRLCRPGSLPNTAFVKGTNFCDLGLRVDSRTGRVIAVSAIDNLTRGASGQAVHNMNLMQGWPETLGLEVVPLVP
ncbi:MAG: N-acetyl-gamma-glutamyl-phosphate reductase [Deltaproteobacteria bacterium]|nr:MAG: N-acetyl-gamma-glutamyl-phosphate reductase [Deltaproteobacteria bacterium]